MRHFHIIAALAIIGLLGCGAPADPPPGLTVLPLELALIEILDSPRLTVQGVALQGEVISGSFTIDSPLRLEFAPLQLGPASASPITVDLLDDASSEPLKTWTLPADSPTLSSLEVLSTALSQPAGIDLSLWVERRVRVRWRNSEPARTVVIAAPRLRHLPGTRGPDILLICSDSHRVDYAPPLSEKMPALQEWAREAVTYRNAFSPASWTLPSITSTLTGLYPRFHATGRRGKSIDNREFDPAQVPLGQFGFRLEDYTQLLSGYPSNLFSIAELLGREGYFSAIISANPLYFVSGLALDGTDMAVNTGVHPGARVVEHAGDVLAGASPERPLFLLVHFMDVHHWAQWYFDETPVTQPEVFREQADRAYSAAVRKTDEAVGSLLDLWADHRPQGMEVFYSDHGEHLADPGIRDGMVTGHGNTVEDVLLRVPLMVRYPGDSGPPAGDIDQAVSLVDLVPTLLQVAGTAAPPVPLSGRSLLESTAPGGIGPRFLFSDFQLYGDEASTVRYRDTKLIINLSQAMMELRKNDRPPKDSDAFETETTLELLEAFEAYRRRSLGFERSYSREVDQNRAAEALRSLGYIR